MRCPACERETPADAAFCAGVVLVEVGRPGGRAFCGNLIRAQVLVRAEGPSAQTEMEAAIARQQALGDESGARLLEGHIPLVRAVLAAVLGDTATQRREFAEAHRLFMEMGATGHAAGVAVQLGGGAR